VHELLVETGMSRRSEAGCKRMDGGLEMVGLDDVIDERAKLKLSVLRIRQHNTLYPHAHAGGGASAATA